MIIKFLPLSFICFVLFVFITPRPVWAQTCTPPVSGDLVIAGDCSFAGTTNGVDAGIGTENTAALTINTGIVVIASGQDIAFGTLILNGGAIALPADGSASLLPGTPLWVTDADDDRYPESTEQIASAAAPNADARRRNIVVSMTLTDCYASSSVFPGQTGYFTTDRGDGSYDYDCDGQVTKARDVCSCSGCAGGCSSAPTCALTEVAEATACGTTGINAGPSSCSRTNDMYGVCISCSESGTTTTVMRCR